MAASSGSEAGEKLRLAKQDIPEEVLRKTLYWVSEHCNWYLDQDESHWTVELLTTGDTCKTCRSEFDRLLNDFLLRDRLDRRTKNLRSRIIEEALRGLDER